MPLFHLHHWQCIESTTLAYIFTCKDCGATRIVERWYYPISPEPLSCPETPPAKPEPTVSEIIETLTSKDDNLFLQFDILRDQLDHMNKELSSVLHTSPRSSRSRLFRGLNRCIRTILNQKQWRNLHDLLFPPDSGA